MFTLIVTVLVAFFFEAFAILYLFKVMQIKLIVDVVIVVKGKSAHDFHCLAT